MKKIFSAGIAALMCATALTASVSAHKDFKSWGDVPKTAAKITLDGKLDEVYNEGLVVDVNLADSGKTGTATGKAYFVWADDGLYCAVEVKDPDICAIDESKNAWEQDGIEITYDWANDGSTRHKRLIHYDGTVVKAGDATVEAIEVKADKTADTYIIETKAALPDGVKAGSGIGVNIVIDDMTDDNSVRTIVRSAQSSGAGENDVANFDYISLSDKEVGNGTAPAAADTDTAAAPATFDLSVVAALLAAASGAVVVSKKRR